MGRHRRATPAPAPVVPPAHSPYEEVSAHTEPGPRHRGSSHRKRGAAPVRTGLLGASAAMAMGAVAVASGLLPGPGGLGAPQGGDRVQAGGPTDLEPEATPSASPSSDREPGGEASRAEKRNDVRFPAYDKDEKKPSKSPKPSQSRSQSQKDSQRDSSGSGSSGEKHESGNSGSSGSGGSSTASQTPDAETSAEAAVLTLVNQERAKVGCRPVTADGDLAKLAGNFSQDMARRGFFSHNSPDGQSPWDRAEAMGISDLGGENIARGQANAQSVMDSWMNSPGHKANILNCDYRTMGVGAHFAEGGPWWTQDFGF